MGRVPRLSTGCDMAQVRNPTRFAERALTTGMRPRIRGKAPDWMEHGGSRSCSRDGEIVDGWKTLSCPQEGNPRRLHSSVPRPATTPRTARAHEGRENRPFAPQLPHAINTKIELLDVHPRTPFCRVRRCQKILKRAHAQVSAQRWAIARNLAAFSFRHVLLRRLRRHWPTTPPSATASTATLSLLSRH